MITRWGRWARALAAAALACATLGSTAPVGAQPAVAKMAPIKILISQSPWYAGFEKLVADYEATTGNKVSLDPNPFGAVLEKSRNSVRAKDGEFDIITINAYFLSEFYQAGFVEPLRKIDPGFRLDPSVITYDDTVYWNEARRFSDRQGELMGVPVNGNIQLLYYRADLYEKHGLKIPKTWDDVAANAKALHDPPRVYGMATRGNRGFAEPTYDFGPFMFSDGGGIFRDPKGGDYTITVNGPQTLRALNFWIALNKNYGAPDPGSVTQAKLIQLMQTGKLAQALIVAAAWAQMDDPTKSAVVGKVNVAPLPAGASGKAATMLGHWIGAIPKNIPPQRKAAALAFLNWFQTQQAQMKYAEFGAVPVRQDVLESSLAAKPQFRWMKPMAESSAIARVLVNVVPSAEVVDAMGLHLNQALIGQSKPAAALNSLARELEAIMAKAGYKTGRLPDLPD